MTKKIVTLTRLAEIIGRHRNQVRAYRLRPDYVDENGCEYWTEKTAQRIAQKVAEAKAAYQPGYGRKIELSGLKRKKRRKVVE
jgi:hypothetical protein